MLMEKTRRQFNSNGLDGLRVIAAMAIALFAHYDHFICRGEEPFPFYNIFTCWFWDFSPFLVELFFLLSGFGMLLGYRRKIATRSVDFATYTKKRIVKLYPMHFLMLIVIGIFMALYRMKVGVEFSVMGVDVTCSNDALTFMQHLFFIQGFSLLPPAFNRPTWFLTQVFLMYLVFYGITYYLGPKKKEVYGYLIAFFIGSFLAVQGIGTIVFNCRALTGFFLGTLLGCIVEYEEERKISDLRLLCQGIAALLIMFGFFAFAVIKGHAAICKNYQLVFYYLVLAWLPLSYATLRIPILAKILGCKCMRYLSGYSFTIYVCHYVVMAILSTFREYGFIPFSYYTKKFFLLYLIILLIVTYWLNRKVEGKIQHWFSTIIN